MEKIKFNELTKKENRIEATSLLLSLGWILICLGAMGGGNVFMNFVYGLGFLAIILAIVLLVNLVLSKEHTNISILLLLVSILGTIFISVISVLIGVASVASSSMRSYPW